MPQSLEIAYWRMKALACERTGRLYREGAASRSASAPLHSRREAVFSPTLVPCCLQEPDTKDIDYQAIRRPNCTTRGSPTVVVTFPKVSELPRLASGSR